jgi:hypothetical protein
MAWVPVGGAMAMAALLSGYFVATTAVLVRKAMRLLQRTQAASGDV